MTHKLNLHCDLINQGLNLVPEPTNIEEFSVVRSPQIKHKRTTQAPYYAYELIACGPKGASQ